MERIKRLDLEEVINATSPLSGEEIMEILHIKEGPKVGEAQKAIEQAIIDGIISDKAVDARRFLRDRYASRQKGK
jgi:hypothetical protein